MEGRERKIQEIVTKISQDPAANQYAIEVTKLSPKSVICEDDIRIKKVLNNNERAFLAHNTEKISQIFRK